MEMLAFQLRQPDDMHAHLRDGASTLQTLTWCHCFARCVVMPNLERPLTSLDDVLAYKARILNARALCEPLMTIYLSPVTWVYDISICRRHGIVGAKLYMAGTTSHSEYGVVDIDSVSRQLCEMERVDLPLLIHGEAPDVVEMKRESAFLQRILPTILSRFPKLRIVLEHISTEEAVAIVSSTPNVFATVTPHHLICTSDDLYAPEFRPNLYCAPILKTSRDREALVQAVVGDSGKFFAGTDSAPWPQSRKTEECCAKGCFTAPVALEIYASVFHVQEDLRQLSTQRKLERFVSQYGADFYGLPYNTSHVTITRETHRVPDSIGEFVPFMARQTLEFKVSRRE
jgi:dihydroorotase